MEKLNKMIIGKFVLLFLIAGSSYAQVKAPEITSGSLGVEVTIRGQEQLDEFFKKIERGCQLVASADDRRYYEDSKKIVWLLCNGREVPDCKKIKRLSGEIGKLLNLNRLDLNNNQLTEIPREIGKLIQLDHLSLHNNRLTLLPKEIGQLTKLERLGLRNNQLTKLTREIGNLTTLRTLDLSNNQLAEIPGKIGKLINLQGLYLQDNWLEFIPGEIGNLGSLMWLDLENNKLESIPVEIGRLTDLRSLFFSRNTIKSVPLELKKMRFFWKLDDDVFLDSPPVPQSDCGLVMLSHSRERVWLRDECRRNPEFKKRVNKIKYTELLEGSEPPQGCVTGCWPTDAGSPHENKVPIEFESRDQLENFVFELEHFKWGEEELERIQVLHLANLGLTEIPKFVFACKNLQRLFLENNEIEEVPTIISELKELTFLQLGNNIIHSLPQSFKELSELRAVILDVNPLDDCFPIPDLTHLKFLEFISLDSGVANRLGMEPIFDDDQKIIDSGIPDMSVMVKPRRSNCIIS
ncbi:leucine-rich repeat domain-containing protein [bacterium]|nr:leucine-rich repeat domain-containing protein [bacterium]